MYDQVPTQVADGIYQVQLPLPFALRIVNCYLLRDGDGWTIVDSGLNYPLGQAAWLAVFDALGIRDESITRIVLTHAHPDHYGMAGWLAERSGAPVLLSPIEQAFAAHVWGGGEPVIQAVAALFHQHGMPDDLIAAVRDQMAVLRPMTRPLAKTTTLAPGARLRIGAREFQAIPTPGHSDGHLAFYCAEERLLLCGDTVLIKITPNISLWPHGRPDPLADFMYTLDDLEQLPVDLALPGHGPLITAFGRRLAELRAHHDDRLLAVERAAGQGTTAFAVCTAIFPTDQLNAHQIRFAMAETLAHLEYLVGAGRVERGDGERVIYCSKT
jgi:glyoxylase-like metal-dependent hydrolase (beta-lactamase superfamily II)